MAKSYSDGNSLAVTRLTTNPSVCISATYGRMYRVVILFVDIETSTAGSQCRTALLSR